MGRFVPARFVAEAWDYTSDTACEQVDGLPLPTCDVDLTANTECCMDEYTIPAFTIEATNPSCELLFRVACPSMSGFCHPCPGGSRRLDAVADSATMKALLNTGSF